MSERPFRDVVDEIIPDDCCAKECVETQRESMSAVIELVVRACREQDRWPYEDHEVVDRLSELLKESKRV